MDHSIGSFRRQELYEKVCTVPIHQLSKQLGFSDVGLAKLCRRHSIPVPKKGVLEAA